MSDDDKNVVNLSDWKQKHKKPNVKPIWVSNDSPKLIAKIDHSDLSIIFIGYNQAHKKTFYKKLSLIETTSLFKSIQDEYASYIE
jgi:hypothetical protein